MTKQNSYYTITGKRLSNSSIMKSYPIIKESYSNQTYMNIWRSIKLNNIDITLFITHEIDYSDWWDTIAVQYYDNSKLWWVLPEINKIENPFEMPEAGTNIRVLREEYLYDFLKEYKGIAIV